MIRNLLLPAVCLLAFAACGTARHTDSTPAEKPALRRLLTADEQRRFDELATAAVVAREAEKYDVAFELLERALAIDPDEPRANFDMAMLRISMATAFDSTSMKRGEEQLARALRLAPENTYYKQTYAAYLTHRGKLSEATRLFEEIAQQRPTDLDVLQTLVQLYEIQKEHAKAISAIDRLETLEGADERYESEKIKNLMALHDTAQAIGIVNTMRTNNPGESNYDVLMAGLLYQIDKRDEAKALLDSVLAAQPYTSNAMQAYIRIYAYESPDSIYPQAVRHIATTEHYAPELRKTVLLEYLQATVQEKQSGAPTDSMAVLHLLEETMAQPFADPDLADLCTSYAYSLVNFSYSDLVPLSENILRVVPENFSARLVLIQQASLAERHLEAAELCREGYTYTPEFLPFYLYGSTELYAVGRLDEALQMLLEGTQHIDADTRPQIATQIYTSIGDLQHAAGHNDKAFEAYDEALQYDAQNTLALNNYAYFLSVENRDLDRAEEMSRKTIEMEPDNGTFLDTYAWILYQQKKYRQAAIYMEEALKNTEPADLSATVLEHAGDICYRAGDTATALGYWKAALRVCDDASDTARLRRKVQRKRL